MKRKTQPRNGPSSRHRPVHSARRQCTPMSATRSRRNRSVAAPLHPPPGDDWEPEQRTGRCGPTTPQWLHLKDLVVVLSRTSPNRSWTSTKSVASRRRSRSAVQSAPSNRVRRTTRSLAQALRTGRGVGPGIRKLTSREWFRVLVPRPWHLTTTRLALHSRSRWRTLSTPFASRASLVRPRVAVLPHPISERTSRNSPLCPLGLLHLRLQPPTRSGMHGLRHTRRQLWTRHFPKSAVLALNDYSFQHRSITLRRARCATGEDDDVLWKWSRLLSGCRSAPGCTSITTRRRTRGSRRGQTCVTMNGDHTLPRLRETGWTIGCRRRRCWRVFSGS